MANSIGLRWRFEPASGGEFAGPRRQGRIVEAYGFDLSPIAVRHAEFVRLAAEAKAEREQIGRLRRRVTIARKAIAQILETVAEYGFGGEEWSRLRLDTQALTKSLRLVERPEEIAMGVASLERQQIEARGRLQRLLETMNPTPRGPENRPHTIPTNQAFYSERNTVMASEGCRSPEGPDPSDHTTHLGLPGSASAEATYAEPKTRQETPHSTTSPSGTAAPRTDSGTVMRLSTDELMRLAPRLCAYLKAPRPAWRDIVDAADWLRGELGISKTLWCEACVAMGREQAAIAVAIVSAKPIETFRSTPGGYFHGMVAKAKAGELNLERTVWGMRQTTVAKSRRANNRPILS
nr:plasmid replication protein RepC [uncultured Rhodopila sp.]